MRRQLGSKLEAMAGQPVDISYRAIGSSSGKAEFLAKTSAYGCAEIPVLESEKTAGAQQKRSARFICTACFASCRCVSHPVVAGETVLAVRRLRPRLCLTGKGTQLEMARPIYNLEAWALATRNPGTQAF